MSRNVAADRFANNVFRRSESDLVIRLRLNLLISFLPVVIALVGVFIFKRSFGEDIIADNLLLIAAELCIIGFILFLMSYRAYKHAMRDSEWMDSLIGYVDSKGCDISDMQACRDRMHAGIKRILMYVSCGLWAFNLLYLLALGLCLYLGVEIVSQHTMLFAFVSFMMVAFQFLVTSGITVFFPGRHDEIQSEFTESMKSSLEKNGVTVPSMVNSVHSRHMLIHVLLLIFTAGLYLVFLFFESSMKLNKHLYNQWDYEVDLLSSIMEEEGASGIGPVSK